MGKLNFDISLLNKESSDSFKNSISDRVYYIPLEDLIKNPLNDVTEKYDTEEELDDLKESVFSIDLQVPFFAYDNNGEYILLGGHRRKDALLKIFNEGKEVSYNSKVLTDHKVPVLFKNKPANKFEELMMMTAMNDQRTNDKRTSIENTKKALELIEELKKDGTDLSGAKRDIIGKIIHRNGRSVSRYINEINGKEKKKQEAKKSVSEGETLTRKIILLTDYIKKVNLKKINKTDKENIKNEFEKLENELLKL